MHLFKACSTVENFFKVCSTVENFWKFTTNIEFPYWIRIQTYWIVNFLRIFTHGMLLELSKSKQSGNLILIKVKHKTHGLNAMTSRVKLTFPWGCPMFSSLQLLYVYLQQHTLQFSCNKQNICVSKIITQILLILHLVTIVCKTLAVRQSFYKVNKWNIISICWTFKMSIGITRILGKLTFWSLMFLHCIHQECVQISAKRRSITSNGLKR